ncbi:hypothetical protein BU14_2222s0001 [Porphyra umbilicalis]|uniref:Uncharacterized protein n=1 Tax=Porphyra umbilicalis TaxID=2786 RepID=A0A1X6NJM0_PORUM|nr:hypothetical protein BU14_2222s0001 [Porphyra umbilicalis]|eukprot:OSX68805.1 hypothetical protein BU14_2222s0001 [Porphyra umbilicalis]
MAATTLTRTRPTRRTRPPPTACRRPATRLTMTTSSPWRCGRSRRSASPNSPPSATPKSPTATPWTRRRRRTCGSRTSPTWRRCSPPTRTRPAPPRRSCRRPPRLRGRGRAPRAPGAAGARPRAAPSLGGGAPKRVAARQRMPTRRWTRRRWRGGR